MDQPLKRDSHKPRNATFTLEERLDLLKILRPRHKLVDSHMNDGSLNETKKEAWISIHAQFVELYPERHTASAKDIRELWRRMKHRARVEVRTKVRAAKRGGIRTLNDEQMGWVPDRENHTVVDINDLGLEADTKAITEFVPLLEEEATVLETRNGVLQNARGDPGPGSSSNASAHGSSADFDYVEVDELDEEVTCVSDNHVKVEPIDIVDEEEHSPLQLDRVSANQTHQFVNSDQEAMPPIFTTTINPLPVRSSSPNSLGSQTGRSANNELHNMPMIESVYGATTMPTSMATTIGSNSKEQELAELKAKLVTEEHRAKMALVKLKQDAARAKLESARAKRSAYDEKRMFYFEKRKMLHTEGGDQM